MSLARRDAAPGRTLAEDLRQQLSDDIVRGALAPGTAHITTVREEYAACVESLGEG